MPDPKKVLVAEDEVAAHDAWRSMLAFWGYQVQTAEDGQKAFELLCSFRPHIMLADLRMPRRDGLQLLHNIRELQLETVAIIISGAGEIPDAVQAIKLGAIDYLCKPIDPPHVERILKSLSEHMDVCDENRRLRHRLLEMGDLGPLFATSLAMRRVLLEIERLAESSASVMITGESGTGKELAARTIHQLSTRKNGPFVGINCAAIPPTLMESEVFGHERGAFTGADRRREGCFEMANHGTLLLDEITEMQPDLQAKLLRVIEERKLRRLGGISEIDLDVRVLATSNQNLERAVHDGNLREDLFYRLNVFKIEMPSLRMRTEDLPLLIESFLRHFAELNHKEIIGVDKECLEALRYYPWPGNVRQLRNFMERASVLCRTSLISIRDLPAEFKIAKRRNDSLLEIPLGTPMYDVKRELITRTIDHTGGNKTRAAKLLGVTPRTLHNRLQRYSNEATPPQ